MIMAATPIAMGLLTGGAIAFAMGLFATLYRFYTQNREKIVNPEDYFLWGGVFMILVSLLITFLF